MNHLTGTILLLLLAVSTLAAQETTLVKGRIVDQKGEGLIGVNVFLDESYDGASTDIDGNYQFRTDLSGEQVLLIQYVGYADERIPVELNGQTIEQNTALREASINLGMAKVTARSFGRTNDKNRTEVLSTLDILTTGGANADVVAALRTLPGTQQVGEQEGLFVRGGAGNETQIFIDGLRVPNFFQSGAEDVAQRGRFSPNLFQGTFFSSGGFSAEYGQALSGSLNLESVDVPLESQVNANLSSVGAQGEVLKVFNRGNSSVGASVNYLNLQPYYGLVNQNRTFDDMPIFLDASFNFRHKTSETGIIKYFGQLGSSNLAFRRESLDYAGAEDAFAVDNRNFYSNLLYREMLGERWKFTTGLVYAANRDAVDQSRPLEEGAHSQEALSRQSTSYQGRSTLSWLGDNSKIIGGVEYQRTDRTDRADSLSRNLRENYSALFLEGTFQPLPRLSARIGVRSEYSRSIDAYNVALRLALNYDLGNKQQLSFAWGHYHQAPDLVFAAQNDQLDYQRSTHYIATFQRTETRRTFRAEIFHKDYADLVKTVPELSNNGSGYARGLELFWRDKKLAKDLDYWVSYSLLDTERDFLDFPRAAQPTFAADHTASLAVKKYFEGIATNVSATFTYATGRPYFDPNQSAEDFLTSRTRDFQNLSFTVAHLTKIGGAFTTLVFSVNNVLGTEQIFGYEYSETNPSRRRARKEEHTTELQSPNNNAYAGVWGKRGGGGGGGG
ncbi:MAG: TonB-dependent receptor, partial [Bacteroidota bacterium]